MNNLEKVFLIDGMALIYRSYYAMIRNPLVSSSGQPTSSIYGFIRSLLKLIKNENPKYISIILDTKAKTFRHKMYSEYKATRKPMPDDLSEQIPILYEIFDLLNISVYKKDGFEADDLIGTISNHFRKKNINTYIYSSDKDLMQLVCDNVFVYSPGNSFVKEKLYNSNEVSSKWGVAPNQIIDYLSLVGDASDNIPGVKGVGSKTAVKLIDKYNNIDEIYSSVNSLDNERMKNKLIDSKKNAYLSKKLVTIDLDVNIAFKLSDMNVDKLKFQNILSKLHDLDIYTFDKDINKKNIEHNTQTTNKKYETINNLFELDSLISNINNYNGKAENIKKACLNVVEKHNGVVPHSYDDLVLLPGVDHTTGKLLTSEIYNIPTVVIDKHMFRIMRLLGFTRSYDIMNIEKDIVKVFKENIWLKLTYLVTGHGRSVCHKIKPKCEICILNRLCPSSSF